LSVAFDTCALVDALQETSAVEKIIDELDRRGDRIVIPMPVVAEILVRYPSEQEAEAFERTLFQQFRIVPVDIMAARIAGRALRRWFAERKEGKAEGERQVVKADLLIVATAAANGVQRMVSNDSDCAMWAKHVHPPVEIVSPTTWKAQLELDF
jgi:predicted nucleic acid-binding protein